MSSLKVRVVQHLESYPPTPHRAALVGNIYGLSVDDLHIESSQLRQIMLNAVTADDDGGWETFELPPGRYLVEALLPSGTVLRKQVDLAGLSAQLELQGPSSPQEWLGWQTFADGYVMAQYQQAQRARDLVRPAQLLVRLLELPPEPQMTKQGSHSPWLDWGMATRLVRSPLPEVNSVLNQFIDSLATSVNSASLRVSEKHSEVGAAGLSVWHFAAPGAVAHTYATQPGFFLNFQSEPVQRFLAVIIADDLACELVPIPVPWLQTASGGEALVDLFVRNFTATPTDHAASYDISRSAVSVRDDVMASVLGYVTSGDVSGAHTVTTAIEARTALFDKVHNPFAAAAGAYVLVSGESASEVRQDWHRWTGNLMDWFPWIADGAIIRGTLMLQQRDYEQARMCFNEALRRGIPFYSRGVRWLFDGLTSLAIHAHRTGGPDSDLQEALRVVRVVAMHTNMAQPLTVLQLGQGS